MTKRKYEKRSIIERGSTNRKISQPVKETEGHQLVRSVMPRKDSLRKRVQQLGALQRHGLGKGVHQSDPQLYYNLRGGFGEDRLSGMVRVQADFRGKKSSDKRGQIGLVWNI